MKIVNNILEITYDNIRVDIFKIDLEFSCNKYSSKKNSIYHINVNDKPLTKRDKYKIKYKCVTCENIHIVGVTQFLRKIQKCSFRCNLCCNKDEIKCKQHTEETKATWIQLKERSVQMFNAFDDDFRDNYFKYHLTEEDYERISKNLVSIQNGGIIIDDLEFWPIFKVGNQMIFTSVFYDKINDIIVKGNQPIMKCENCGEIWRAKSLEKFKNCHKIMCQQCTLCNNTFKIRAIKNCNNQTVLYQSKLELKFIEWCGANGEIVTNGPNILYNFEGKVKKYRVDFQIRNILIEVKDNHIWHNNQLKSGMWKAKENAVKELITNGVYKDFYLITPQNWLYSLEKIKKRLNKI